MDDAPKCVVVCLVCLSRASFVRSHAEPQITNGGYFMRERRMIGLVILWCRVAAILLMSTRLTSAQDGAASKSQWAEREQPPTIYNPYPPGILPSDLESEIASGHT